MTFNEIRQEVCYKVWGDVPPPVAAVEKMPRLIYTTHKDLQKDYNFWFMQGAEDYILTTSGLRLYPLPADFKELVYCCWFMDEVSAYSRPLRSRNLGHYTAKAEYPQFFQIINNEIKLFPIPSDERELVLSYWKYLIAPDPTNSDFYSYEDDFTRNGYEAIIQYCVWKIKSELDINNAGASNYEQFVIALDNLKRQDFNHRQSQFTDMDYRGI